ncbi:MAG: hypothetical protein ACYDCK_13350 [Thermoplasmatota archaeon]
MREATPPPSVIAGIAALVVAAALGALEPFVQPGLLDGIVPPPFFALAPRLYAIVVAFSLYVVPVGVALVLAVYLWGGRDWARMVVLFSNAIPGTQLVVVSGFLSGVVAKAPNDAATTVELGSLVLSLAAVVLLFLPSSRAWFKEGPSKR